MFFVTNLCLCVFSVVLLLAVRFSSRRTAENSTLNSRVFAAFLYTTVFLLIADLLSRFDGRTETIYLVLNHTGNFFLFLLNPLLPVMWLLYAHNQIFCDDKKTLKLSKPLIAFIAINTALTVVSLINGWYYTIDASNVYHRGILFLIPAAWDQAIMIATFILLIVNRKRIERQYFVSLLFFGIPPTICIVLQLFIYGIAFAPNGIAISLIIMFINTQNRRMNIDYLTGVFNRKQLDYYITDKIRGATVEKSFSAIFLDLDDFKTINDSHGHQTGDDALKTMVTLLKKCTRHSDFIARYGGDEFFIVMEISEPEIVAEVVERIRNCVAEFNNSNVSLYKLSLSMGYLIYDTARCMSVEEFEAEIDKIMYTDKSVSRTISR